MTLWRGLFFLLVLANLVAFAWTQGYFGNRDEGREPGRLADQLHPEKIVIAQAGKEPAAPPPPPTACKAVSGLPVAEVETVRALLESRAEGAEALGVAVKPEGESQVFTVAIVGLTGKAAAEKKAGELRTLGISEFKSGESTRLGGWTIVFGVFDNEAAAGNALAALNKKGVKSARIEAGEKRAAAARLEVRGPADLVAKRLSVALAGIAGTTVGDCP